MIEQGVALFDCLVVAVGGFLCRLDRLFLLGELRKFSFRE